jgi:type IV secretory pathway VirD2 relaxase
MLRRVRAAGTVRRQPKIAAGSHAVRRQSANPSHLYRRRSVVKASFRRNRHNGRWTAHARYLARENAQRANERGLGFDAVRDGLDPVATVRDWEQSDQLMWSFIVSPEDSECINLRDHVRNLMAEMERDLDTRLEWVAVDHHNTEDTHVHLLVRGVREDGRPLEIDREYLKRGVRELSERLIEREIGPRSEREVLLARERVIEREQWTEIDRALHRRAGFDRIVIYDHIEPRTEGARVRAQQEMDRLHYLEKLGLARRIAERTWELSTAHEAELRRRQREHDIIKTRAHERHRARSNEREFEK